MPEHSELKTCLIKDYVDDSTKRKKFITWMPSQKSRNAIFIYSKVKILSDDTTNEFFGETSSPDLYNFFVNFPNPLVPDKYYSKHYQYNRLWVLTKSSPGHNEMSKCASVNNNLYGRDLPCTLIDHAGFVILISSCCHVNVHYIHGLLINNLTYFFRIEHYPQSRGRRRRQPYLLCLSSEHPRQPCPIVCDIGRRRNPMHGH